MARKVFSTDSILDAARELVIARGPRAATVAAIAEQAAVPVGSIYHRFGSVDELLARTWLRAARRSQEAAKALEISPQGPLATAQAVALALYDYCLSQPKDTLLLDALSRTELLGRTQGEVHEELERANEGVEERMAVLARGLFGRADERSRDLVLLAIVDMPHGFAHRQIASGRRTPARRERLAAAVAAVLG